MQTTLPAIQSNIKRAKKIVYWRCRRKDKRLANRIHRRALGRMTHNFERDPESFESETFEAPTFSSRDIC
jgi:hypothetical protein